MKLRNLSIGLCIAGGLALATSIAIAQNKDAKPGAGHADKGGKSVEGQPQLPPGWTEDDMKACMEAGTPGKMHEFLAECAGTWQGKCSMWMAPDTEPAKSDCTNTVKAIMDGRFIQSEVAGEMPGMGPFKGLGLYGYDNVTQKFVGSWVDNCGTAIMNGTGELSADRKVLTWTYSYTCPITKKPTKMREVETTTGPNAKTFEMYSTDPKSGKEFKMMVIEYTRKA